MINTIEASKQKRYPANGWSMASGIMTTEAKTRGKSIMFAEEVPATPQSVSAPTTPTVVKRSMFPHKRINPTRMKKLHVFLSLPFCATATYSLIHESIRSRKLVFRIVNSMCLDVLPFKV